MDSIEILSGGMRLFGDDLNFMQQGVKVAMAASVKTVADYNGGWVILSGFNTSQVNGNTYSISGGWAYIDGEICYFIGDNVTFVNSVDWATIHFESYVYDNPVGSRLMSNNVTYNPQKRREIRLSNTPTGKTLARSNRYEFALKNLLDSLTTEQSNVVTLAPNVGIHGAFGIKLYKKDGRVFFTANLETDPTQNYITDTLLCTLPVGFRPDRIIIIPVYNSSKTMSYLSIGNNGGVFFLNTDAQNWIASSIVYAHNVSFDAV